MMSGMILKCWKTVKEHVPLIKFRKGGSFSDSAPSAPASAATSKIKPGNMSNNNVHQSAVIEDWQLPPHYRRSLLDEKEIDAINSGGAY